jgi:uncharacterized protein (DUF427 family)
LNSPLKCVSAYAKEKESLLMPTPIVPKAGQESVWDYPRPPALEAVPHRLRWCYDAQIVADTTKGYRVLETSHPPVYYFPIEDVQQRFFRLQSENSFCEWKGHAQYWDLIDPDTQKVLHPKIAWSYPDPTPRFAALKNAFAFYLRSGCSAYVGDEQATPQPGEFYGGWITPDIVGPFKGIPGSWGW